MMPGMMMGGPVGLFVGSVVLALAYKILMALMEAANQKAEEAE